MVLSGKSDIVNALEKVGELLEAQGVTASIVIIGGAAMNLRGYADRATTDVDIVAFGGTESGGRDVLRKAPYPLPEELRRAVYQVASDLGLDPDWLNSAAHSQWDTGLPPGLEARLDWRTHGGLAYGIAGRLDLIFFKLYAAADQVSADSVHCSDLLALHPTHVELAQANAWAREQDPSTGFADSLEKATAYVTARIQGA